LLSCRRQFAIYAGGHSLSLAPNPAEKGRRHFARHWLSGRPSLTVRARKDQTARRALDAACRSRLGWRLPRCRLCESGLRPFIGRGYEIQRFISRRIAPGDCLRLRPGFGRKTCGSGIGQPDLDRPQPCRAHALPVSSHTAAGRNRSAIQSWHGNMCNMLQDLAPVCHPRRCYAPESAYMPRAADYEPGRAGAGDIIAADTGMR
jgi:hypothetical protein